MSRKQFDLAFEEAAAELSVDGIPDERGCVTIVSPVRGVPQVHVAYVEDDDAVGLAAEVGLIPTDDPDLLREFMQDNYFCSATRGAMFAMDADGRVVLQRKLLIERLDGKILAEALADFAEIAFRARSRLYRTVTSEAGDESLDGGVMDGFMQV